MSVRRIVANVATDSPEEARRFYGEVLGLEVLMDMGWIVTYGSGEPAPVQISFASEGGAGTPVPDLSIEVDDLVSVRRRMEAAGFKIKYGPVAEPWGVTRFFVRDPFGRLVNILQHGAGHGGG
ncbi:VOC family protein [Aurantimonas sp. VKM B-3413]|uniref:VOC family protein n=1 Tax=Aurantimonas sp. VKM B-3413 TaxID=2779401 RepID=UPI001E5C3AC6|nr:VOC family protein [Aurantimonas sp. VKM B-3413]MCB8837041.1 VOC family protein [Aurantimonas sp. VKM B-3413]